MYKEAKIDLYKIVGLASLKSHSIYRRSRGMYFSTQDRGNMSAMVYNWPHDEVDVIVVTDGSRVLGLGDLGANGMQVSVNNANIRGRLIIVLTTVHVYGVDPYWQTQSGKLGVNSKVV